MDTSTGTRLIDTEPVRKQKSRGVDLEWLVSEGTDDRGDHVKQIAVLSVSHYGRSEMWGRAEYCISAHLGRQTERERTGSAFTARGFRVFSGVNICSTGNGAVKRYSPKKVDEYVDVALAQLRERRDDEDIRRIFGELPEESRPAET